jgi:hypothetical protein
VAKVLGMLLWTAEGGLSFLVISVLEGGPNILYCPSAYSRELLTKTFAVPWKRRMTIPGLNTTFIDVLVVNLIYSMECLLLFWGTGPGQRQCLRHNR